MARPVNAASLRTLTGVFSRSAAFAATALINTAVAARQLPADAQLKPTWPARCPASSRPAAPGAFAPVEHAVTKSILSSRAIEPVARRPHHENQKPAAPLAHAAPKTMLF